MEEDEVYLQLTLPEEKDNDDLNIIYSKIINQLTGLDNLVCKKFFNPFESSVVISYFQDSLRVLVPNGILEQIKDNINKIKKGDIFISDTTGKNKYIEETFKDTNLDFFHILHRILICRSNNLTTMEIGYLQFFMRKIDFDIVHASDTFNVRRTLDLETIRIPVVDFNLRRLDLREDDNSCFFKIIDHLQLESYDRIEESKLPFFFYQTTSVKSKYLFLLKFKQLHQRENLPTASPKYLYKNLDVDENRISCLNKKNYHDITSEEVNTNFKTREFETLEEAVVFLIQLKKKNIQGSIIPHNEYYYCCYQSETDEEFRLDENKARSYLLDKIPGDIEKLLEVPLSKLVTGYLDEGKFILPDGEKFTDEEIPIDNYILENSHIFPYNLSCELETFPEKKKFGFDRSGIVVDIGLDIRLEEKVDCINSLELIIEGMKIELEEDFWINDEDSRDFFKICVRKLWRSGYLLTTYGLWRYISTGEIIDKDITFPNWFRSDGERDWVWLKKQLELVS